MQLAQWLNYDSFRYLPNKRNGSILSLHAVCTALTCAGAVPRWVGAWVVAANKNKTFHSRSAEPLPGLELLLSWRRAPDGAKKTHSSMKKVSYRTSFQFDRSNWIRKRLVMGGWLWCDRMPVAQMIRCYCRCLVWPQLSFHNRWWLQNVFPQIHKYTKRKKATPCCVEPPALPWVNVTWLRYRVPVGDLR